MEAFEHEAEVLVGYQLDLLALLEHQLRAVHHTMRHIEKLRTARKRVGPELSNGQRQDTLDQLGSELDALERHITAQRESCTDMHNTLNTMHARLTKWRATPEPTDSGRGSAQA